MARRDESIGELLKQLSQETATLVRQELDLAKAEMAQKAKRFGLGAGMFGGAGVVGFLALAALTACLIIALAYVMPAAVAALIVAVVYGAVAGAMALLGRRMVQQATPPVPDQTAESVKEDVQWVKSQTRSERR